MVQRLLIVEDDCLMAEAAADYFTATCTVSNPIE